MSEDIKTIAIIAGNHRQFTHFLEGQYGPGTTIRYIEADRAEKLQGLRIDDILTVGTWYERKDAHDVLSLAKARLAINQHNV